MAADVPARLRDEIGVAVALLRRQSGQRLTIRQIHRQALELWLAQHATILQDQKK